MRRLLLILCLLLSCLTTSAAGKSPLTIAVASNFLRPAELIATAFTKDTGIPVRISSGSTGKLYAQIVHGAPYDVFLAADTERPRLLERENLALAGSYTVYASGFLTLWSSRSEFAGQDCLQALLRSDRGRVAIANPQTAPYGAVALSYLQQQEQWPAIRDRLVYGESVSQAFQFVATGNADFGIVATSLLRRNAGLAASCSWQLFGDGVLDLVVPQAGVALRRSAWPDEARSFLSYLRHPEIQDLLADFGYSRGESPSPDVVL